MTEQEIAEAQEVIDSVLNGTGELKPLTPVFPAPVTQSEDRE